MHHDATFLLRQRIPYILSHLPLIHRISAYRRPVISCGCAVGSVGMPVLSDLPFWHPVAHWNRGTGPYCRDGPELLSESSVESILCRFFRHLDGNYIGFNNAYIF